MIMCLLVREKITRSNWQSRSTDKRGHFQKTCCCIKVRLSNVTLLYPHPRLCQWHAHTITSSMLSKETTWMTWPLFYDNLSLLQEQTCSHFKGLGKVDSFDFYNDMSLVHYLIVFQTSQDRDEKLAEKADMGVQTGYSIVVKSRSSIHVFVSPSFTWTGIHIINACEAWFGPATYIVLVLSFSPVTSLCSCLTILPLAKIQPQTQMATKWFLATEPKEVPKYQWVFI